MDCTPIGKALAASKKPKVLNDGARGVDGIEDEFDEAEYSAAHFDSKLVMQMLQQTLVNNRTSQQFILLEGFCNSKKLEDEKDKWQFRVMDELFSIEKGLGEIAGAVSLNAKLEEKDYTADKFEEFPKEEVVEVVKEPKLDDDGNPIPDEEPAAPVDEDAPVVKKFDPTQFKWTITNKSSHNLPQLFKDFKGAACVIEEHASSKYSDVSQEAVVKSMDEFCASILKNHNSKYIY